MANSEFRAKLTALLDDLIKTAMVDICSLTGVCTASLRMELNASKSENEELKRKILIMEQRLRGATVLENVEHQNKTSQSAEAKSCDVLVFKNTLTINELPEPTTQSRSNTETGIQKPDIEFRGDLTSDVEDKFQDSDSGINDAQTETQQVHFSLPKKENEEMEVTVKNEELEWYNSSFVPESDLQQSSMCNSEYSSFIVKENADTFSHLQENNTMSEVASDVSMMNKNKGPTYICDICGKTLLSEKSLNVHYTVHTADRSHECTQCGKQFVNKTNLQIHQNIHSIRNKKQHSSNSPKGMFVCSICGKRLLTVQGLNCHLTTHSAERPLICIWCGKRFAQPHNLKIHQNTHTGAKPFTCTVCQLLFPDLHSFKKHKTMHTE